MKLRAGPAQAKVSVNSLLFVEIARAKEIVDENETVGGVEGGWVGGGQLFPEKFEERLQTMPLH